MMGPLLLLPDFPLILGGFCLCLYTAFERPTWDVVERLVYPLLLPALLLASIVRSPLQLAIGLSWALPTASSAHVLAAHMGGNGPASP